MFQKTPCGSFHKAVTTATLLLFAGAVFWPAAAHAEGVLLSKRFSDVLPADLQEGPGYAIDDNVRIGDNRYHFNAQTDYGGFSAKGLPMLELRLREHNAIEQLSKLSSVPRVMDGVTDVAKEMPRGAMTLLKDPLGSIARIPAGLRRNVGALVDPLERRAGSQVRRDLALSVGADAETRNPVLSNLLDKLALKEDLGRIGAQVGLGLVLPGVGLLSTNEEIRHKLQSMGPRGVANEVRKDLRLLGVGDDAGKAFAESTVLTSTEKLIFVSHLKSMRGVQGLESLVTGATDTPSEAHLLSKFEEARVLAQLHQAEPIEIIHSVNVPVAQLRSGRFIAVTAVDLVCQTDSMTADVNRFRQTNPDKDVTVLVTGRMTDSAKSLLRQAKIQVYEANETIQR